MHAGIQVYFVAGIQVYFVAGIQVFQNDDKLCPERHGGDNITRLYIDSSKPVPLGKRSRKKVLFLVVRPLRPLPPTPSA